MLLTIDVGNTHTVLGLFDGEDIVEHWRISTDARRTADELAVLLQGLMGMHPLLGEELGDGIDGIAICSTVPSVLHELREVTRRYYGDVPAVLVEPGIKTGVPILMDNPKEVGADRIINAVAAVELYGGPAIVVRSEEHTSELQSRQYLVCRLLLEKKKPDIDSLSQSSYNP